MYGTYGVIVALLGNCSVCYVWVIIILWRATWSVAEAWPTVYDACGSYGCSVMCVCVCVCVCVCACVCVRVYVRVWRILSWDFNHHWIVRIFLIALVCINYKSVMCGCAWKLLYNVTSTRNGTHIQRATCVNVSVLMISSLWVAWLMRHVRSHIPTELLPVSLYLL